MTRNATVRFLVILGSFLAAASHAQAQSPIKKVLLIGQRRDHPPGAHQYMAGHRVLARCLQNIPDLDLKIVQADEPWPEGPELLQDVDGIVLSLGQGGRWIQKDPKRFAEIQRIAKGEAGIVAIHWAIGAKADEFILPYRDIIGGIHGGKDRKFVISKNELSVIGPKHPIMRGVRDLVIKDEWYYRLKFSKGELEPLLAAKIDGENETVAWAYVRESGGRSFGFSGMHFHENWKNQSLRRMISQAVLWSVHLAVPDKGLAVDVPEAIYTLNQDE